MIGLALKGQEVRSGLLRVRIPGMDATEYRIPSYFLGDPDTPMAAQNLPGLSDRALHLPSELSGGQQQRVGIARALAKEPRLLLADEPTGNLDEDTRDDIISLLEELWRQHALTLVLVTHDRAIADRARRVGVMTEGHLFFERDAADESVRALSR